MSWTAALRSHFFYTLVCKAEARSGAGGQEPQHSVAGRGTKCSQQGLLHRDWKDPPASALKLIWIKTFLSTFCLLQAASCCCSAGGCLVLPVPWQKVQRAVKREAAHSKSRGHPAMFPAMDLCLQKLSDELTPPLVPVIGDTAKKSLLQRKQHESLGR